jgi:hypothetical protein
MNYEIRSRLSFSSDAVRHRILFDVKTDFGCRWFGWRRGRVEDFHDALEDIHDSGLMNIQTGFELLLKQGQFSGRVPECHRKRSAF